MKNYFSNLSRSCFILIALTFSANFLQAQVAINDDGSEPNGSAMLDVSSSDKGLLIPRLTSAQKTTLASTAVAGLMVYDTNLNRFFFFNGATWESGSVGNLFSQNGSNIYPTVLTDNVGIGTTTPARQLEVLGSLHTARLSSASTGAYLEFVGSNSVDWAIGANIGSMRIASSTDEFATSTDQYAFTATYFHPYSTNVRELGISAYRWKNLYSVLGNFSGAVATGALTTSGNATISGSVGIGTLTPARKLEVNGPNWQTARISSSSSGATLEFVSTKADKDDWSIGLWNNNIVFLNSTDNFTSFTDQYLMTTSSFYPFYTNTKTLGASTKRWSTLYSGVGDFSSAGSGIAGATVHSENTLTTGGVAGSFKTNGTDATIVLGQDGDGPFLKAFGPNGGNEELRIDNDGKMIFYNSVHTQTITIDGDDNGDGRITTNEIQITGGSDLSELFDLSDYENIQKGMVVIIDENTPGSLKISQTSYDRKVAGIVSGANDIKPGLIMSQKGTIADGEHLIALSGRVYCMVDASESPIKVGDMLTTSSVPGHAMKVKNFDKARGAIIGKAMTSLDSGKGLVLVLVSLQ